MHQRLPSELMVLPAPYTARNRMGHWHTHPRRYKVTFGCEEAELPLRNCGVAPVDDSLDPHLRSIERGTYVLFDRIPSMMVIHLRVRYLAL